MSYYVEDKNGNHILADDGQKIEYTISQQSIYSNIIINEAQLIVNDNGYT